MVEMLDFKVGIAAVDLLAKADASAQVEIGERREARLERREAFGGGLRARKFFMVERDAAVGIEDGDGRSGKASVLDRHVRSEEHTSELQSLMRISYAVFCLQKQTKNS